MELITYKELFREIQTPFYFYDTKLLETTIAKAKNAAQTANAEIHFAVKSNANATILGYMRDAGLGADCVSGYEIKRCIEVGIPANKIMFAGVGKTDAEIRYAIEQEILCFNVESLPELKIINQLAAEQGKIVNIAFRINPDIDAHTHAYITTGLEENKFGISMNDMIPAIKHANGLKNVKFYGLHFHIGSQILNLLSFKSLCKRINELQDALEKEGIMVPSINVGGGLGVDYQNPEKNEIARFDNYFNIFKKYLKLRSKQSLHCELGRALTAQCGALITKTTFVKQTKSKQIAIVDAGFTDLIRPALYQAHHKIINIDSNKRKGYYDVVGPICESSDVFDKNIKLNHVQRGDLLAILSAGAYGHVMASCYNCRPLVKEYCIEDLIKKDK